MGGERVRGRASPHNPLPPGELEPPSSLTSKPVTQSLTLNCASTLCCLTAVMPFISDEEAFRIAWLGPAHREAPPPLP